MKLNELKAQAGSTHRKMRVGRGIGSGKGKTCGRGVKGQKSRQGVAINGFEGGQTPLHMRLPKIGFTNIFRKEYVEINLGQLQMMIDAKRLDPKAPITEDVLVQAGVIRRRRDGVKLLVKGELKTKIDLHISKATKAAVSAVEKAGGTVTVAA
ncbi:MAG: 50S ribosomal protein L15 [Rhodospirillales bacterium]|nr:50S ribosomal protein L15 [Rhodospirillales bacterium]